MKSRIFLYSGTSPQFGEAYNAAIHPNAIDPHVFMTMKENYGWSMDHTQVGFLS